ncbi:hypothetical protein CIW48_17060 [Methylobacterium sp. P1-11]|uniref:malonate transporter subunit MadL n=1 Tax=Methylobacterium sp. P1-11 TaxID=2024616 RepID=UPI0011EFE8BA|nr:hypothetical protein CIW48_17060 [Methylobacterium sp. P1-11]
MGSEKTPHEGATPTIAPSVALLAGCTRTGLYYLGDPLGLALRVNANVGGVAIAMILLNSAAGSLVPCFGAVALVSRTGRCDPGSGAVEHGGSA